MSWNLILQIWRVVVMTHQFSFCTISFHHHRTLIRTPLYFVLHNFAFPSIKIKNKNHHYLDAHFFDSLFVQPLPFFGCFCVIWLVAPGLLTVASNCTIRTQRTSSCRKCCNCQQTAVSGISPEFNNSEDTFRGQPRCKEYIRHRKKYICNTYHCLTLFWLSWLKSRPCLVLIVLHVVGVDIFATLRQLRQTISDLIIYHCWLVCCTCIVLCALWINMFIGSRVLSRLHVSYQ